MEPHSRSLLLTFALLPATAYAGMPNGEAPAAPAGEAREAAEPPAYLVSPARVEDDPKAFKVSWKDGLSFETADKQFRVRIGGRITNDWAFFSEDIEEAGGVSGAGVSNFDFENGTAFRRVRLQLEAWLYEKTEFKASFDFVNNSDFADVYVGYLATKAANVRVGQFKEPFSIEEATSANYIAFMERAPIVSPLAPSRNTGLMLHGALADERVEYGVGIFKEENVETGGSGGFSDTSEFNITARVSGVPVYEDEGKKLVHLGVAGSLREPRNESFDVDFFAPVARGGLSPTLVRNTAFAADESTLLGAEAATVFGPWWTQAEYIVSDVDAQDGFSDPTIDGYYVATGYFVTGETRGYKKSTGTFDKIKTNTVFGKDGGSGAVEVAVRYGTLEFQDLRHSPVGGIATATADDELSDITLGVNWYLNTNTRVMFNVVDFDLDSASSGIDEDGRAFMTRSRSSCSGERSS